MKALAQEFWQEEDGLQTVELVLILLVMVGLVAVLRTQAGSWLSQVNAQVSTMISSSVIVITT